MSDTPTELSNGEKAVKNLERASGDEVRVTMHDTGLWVHDLETGEQAPVGATELAEIVAEKR